MTTTATEKAPTTMKEPYILDVTIDRSSSLPLHTQLATPLIEKIQSGELAPGTRLEDEVSMAKRLHVSRPTARKALETLVNQGLIIRRRGAGTQVTPRQVHRPMALTSLQEDLLREGHVPTTHVLDWLREPANPTVAAMLRISEGSPTIHIRRLRLTDDQPLAILSNHLTPDLAPSKDELAHAGLYELLRERGIEMALGIQQIGARLASADEARLLAEPTGAALLTMQRTAYDASHRAIEYGTHVYRSSMYTYSQTVFA